MIIRYTLLNNSIKIEWFVKNTNDCDMYFSIGAHPAFNVPFNSNETIEDYYLDFKTTGDVNQYLLSGPFVCDVVKVNNVENINLKPELFENDALIYDNVESIAICSREKQLKDQCFFQGFPTSRYLVSLL